MAEPDFGLFEGTGVEELKAVIDGSGVWEGALMGDFLILGWKIGCSIAL